MFPVNRPKDNGITSTQVPRVPLDEVHVFAVHLGEIAANVGEFASLLSADEQQRAEKFQFDGPRRQFIATRAALRTHVGRLLNIPASEVEMVVDERGKPHLGSAHAASNLRFNVAHSGDLGLVAVAAGCDIGIDIEVHREVTHLEAIARRYFHPTESVAIDSLPPFERARAFLRCWTGKEAVVKSVGTGLAESLSRFCAPVRDYQGEWIDIPLRDATRPARVWLQPLALNDGYLAAVACVGQQRRARCFTFRW